MTETRPPARRGNPALIGRRVRDIHTWIGLLIAPSVVFFALTGMVQLFGLHEAKPEAGYTPPPLLERLSAAHKDQVFSLPRRRRPQPAPGEAAAPAAAEADHDHDHEAGAGADHDHDHAPAAAEGPKRSMVPVYLLKWFFTLVALGLTVSTGLGVWLALTFTRNRRLAWALLILGAVIPAALLAV